MSTRKSISVALTALIVGVSACVSPQGVESDSGMTNTQQDSGASPVDSGSPRPDAGNVTPDAGNVTPDAGPADAGNPETDAGPVPVDAGNMVPDAGGCSPVTDAGPSNGHAIQTVFLILMENQDWSAISAANAPYINGTLLPMAAYATDYSNPPGIHPSEPNYLWLEAGTNFGILADGVPATDHQSTTAHLVTLLDNVGISWKSYQESVDGLSCPLNTEGGTNGYAPKHDPMVYFDDITDTNSPTSATCISHVRPYMELAGDLACGTQARYNFITPNLCDDGHNDCKSGGSLLTATADEVGQQDAWLKTNIPLIMNSDAYRNGGAIFITWDESEPSLSCVSLSPQCPVGMIILSPDAKVGHMSATPYTHSSTLRTMEDIFSVQPYLGGAANATNLSEFFQTFP